MTVLGGESFEGQLGHGWSPHQWISTLTKESALALVATERDSEKKATYEPGTGASPDIKSAGALPSLQNYKKLISVAYKPGCLWHFVIAV